MMRLLRTLDKATGYVFVPSSGRGDAPPNPHALLSAAAGPLPSELGDIDDVQERWIDNRETYDELEREQWGLEAEVRARRAEVEQKEFAREARRDMGLGEEEEDVPPDRRLRRAM